MQSTHHLARRQEVSDNRTTAERAQEDYTWAYGHIWTHRHHSDKRRTIGKPQAVTYYQYSYDRARRTRRGIGESIIKLLCFELSLLLLIAAGGQVCSAAAEDDDYEE